MSTFYDPTVRGTKYRIQIDSAGLAVSGTGTAQIELHFRVLGVQVGTDWRHAGPEWPNRALYLALTPNTLGTAAEPGWVASLLGHLGFSGQSFNDLSALVGRVEWATVKHDQYDGNTVERWSILAGGGGPKNPAPANTVTELDARFADVLATIRAKAPPAQQQASPPPATPPIPPKRAFFAPQPDSEPIPF